MCFNVLSRRNIRLFEQSFNRFFFKDRLSDEIHYKGFKIFLCDVNYCLIKCHLGQNQFKRNQIKK